MTGVQPGSALRTFGDVGFSIISQTLVHRRSQEGITEIFEASGTHIWLNLPNRSCIGERSACVSAEVSATVRERQKRHGLAMTSAPMTCVEPACVRGGACCVYSFYRQACEQLVTRSSLLQSAPDSTHVKQQNAMVDRVSNVALVKRRWARAVPSLSLFLNLNTTPSNSACQKTESSARASKRETTISSSTAVNKNVPDDTVLSFVCVGAYSPYAFPPHPPWLLARRHQG